MSPRPGGEADKFGNRYEGRWTVRHLLYVLFAWVDSVRVEAAGDIGLGAEFAIRRGSRVEVHQVKRQAGNANAWTLQALDTKGVLKAASQHVLAGREFHFVSTVPAQSLNELTDRARRSDSAQSFVDTMLTEKLRPDFNYLGNQTVFGSAEAAWRVLKGIHVRWPDEQDILDVNGSLASILLEGADPALAAVGLADLVLDHLNVELDAPRIEGLLEGFGLRRSRLLGSPTLAGQVRSATAQWKDSVARELLQPVIPRSETTDAWGRLNDDGRTVFVIGAAGGGKSGVMHEVVREAESAGWPVLALRLDRVDPFGSPAALGEQLGLGVSPVAALAAVGHDDPCLLAIDQLDAVSLASGRMPTSFDAVASLLREAAGFPNMSIALACRKFDVDNDERIRAVTNMAGVTQVEVGRLTDERIDSAVRAMDLPTEGLTARQRKLLSSPLNLVLLYSIADQEDALSFGSSRDLFDAYWERKRRNCRERRPTTRFNDVIGVLADAMSAQQRLSVPLTVLDADDLAEDAQVLESEHVLVRDGRRYAFFHEAFFDYAFARRWTSRGQALVDFLVGGEQELFRRGQVRQVLNHLHEDDPDRFIQETEGLLLRVDIRFHIKDAVIAVLRALPAPTTGEWAMVRRVIDTAPDFVDRLWLMLRTLPWFDRLNAEGEIEGRLAGDEADQNQALGLMLGGTKERADRLAEILAPHAGKATDYPAWLRWVTRFADLHTSRRLLDLVIDALGRGEYAGWESNLWMSASKLSQRQPAWAVELIAAYLTTQPSAFDLNDAGQVRVLTSRDDHATELIRVVAEQEPKAFAEALVPYVQRVVQLTEYDTADLPIKDRQFSYYAFVETSLGELEDVVLQATRTALCTLAAQDPVVARPILTGLAADLHKTVQWLLYEAMQAAGEAYAEWAAELLLDGDHRLSGNYTTARSVLAAISPYVSADTFGRLEQAILRLRVPSERRPRIGLCAFNLLSGLEESRLSENGRRRLGELRRAFNVQQPSTQPLITYGSIRSPVPEAAVEHMTDAQWLRAIAKYDTDREDWSTMQGGARELSNVLQKETEGNPDRFARLAVQLTPAANAAYSNGILLGLGNASIPGSAEVVFEAIRHIASLGHGDNDRWLAWPLRRHLRSPIPDDIIELLINKALHSTSPKEDRWPTDTGGSETIGQRIGSEGINVARGGSAEMLGDILIADVDGHRTSLVVPSLNQLASDPSVAVRSCVAHLVAACLRHAQAKALEAFDLLVDADDRLLATHHVVNLVVYVVNASPATAQPVISRMLASDSEEVRRLGGEVAAFAGLEFRLDAQFQSARTATDTATRRGLAAVCAQRLPQTTRPDLASATLRELFDDPDLEIRKAAARLAPTLRGRALGPFKDLLVALIESATFDEAIDQLLITLERAPDRVDELAIACAQRFVSKYGADIGNIATSAAGNADEVAQLVLRAYVQATSSAGRSAALDLIDKLLIFAAHGVDERVEAAER